MADYLFAVQSLPWNAGSDDVDTVQSSFACDAVRLAFPTESVFFDEQAEVLAHFVAPQDLPHRQADLLAAAQRSLFSLRGCHDLLQLLLGGFQQLVAFPASLFRQQRIVACNQPLARVGGMLNLGQVLLVEQ